MRPWRSSVVSRGAPCPQDGSRPQPSSGSASVRGDARRPRPARARCGRQHELAPRARRPGDPAADAPTGAGNNRDLAKVTLSVIVQATPPSTRTVVPVMYEARSESRNSITSATSGAPPDVQWHLLDERLLASRHGPHRVAHGNVDVAGRDRIDPDAARRKLTGEVTRVGRQPGFARAIQRRAFEPPDGAGQAADVDDRPAVLEMVRSPPRRRALRRRRSPPTRRSIGVVEPVTGVKRTRPAQLTTAVTGPSSAP